MLSLLITHPFLRDVGVELLIFTEYDFLVVYFKLSLDCQSLSRFFIFTALNLHLIVLSSPLHSKG